MDLESELKATSMNSGLSTPFDTEKFHPNPFEIVQYYLPTTTLVSFSQSCKKATALTASALGARMPYELMLAVVQGNQAKAEKIINLNPELLTKNTASVIDYSGRMIQKKTAFQAALINSDVEMAEMIKPYFVALENGQDKLESQFDEVFPEGIDAQVAMQQSQAFDFGEIAQAIINAPQDAIKQALAKNFDENKYELHMKLNSFRVLFDEISENEEIFNPYHLLNAYKCHNDNFFYFFHPEQRDLFWRQIIGYTQRKLPACFAQAFVQGLHYICKEGKKLKRSFSLHHDNGKKIFPLNNAKDEGIGFDYAAGAFGASRWRPQGSAWGATALNWVRYFKQKNTKLGELICPQIPEGTTCGFLM